MTKLKNKKIKFFYQLMQVSFLILLIIWNKLLFFGQNSWSLLQKNHIINFPGSTVRLVLGVLSSPRQLIIESIGSEMSKNLVDKYDYLTVLQLIGYLYVLFLFFYILFLCVIIILFWLKLNMFICLVIDRIFEKLQRKGIKKHLESFLSKLNKLRKAE